MSGPPAGGAGAAGFPVPLAVGLLLLAPLAVLLRAAGLERTNFQGRTIATGGGLAFVAAALAAAVWAPDPISLVPAVTVAGFGLLGLVDDRWGTPEFKGLRGHLRALRGGKVTTGLLKAGGGLLLAGGAATLLAPGWQRLPTLFLIALCANLFNLLDLRPLRALKAFWPAGVALCVSGAPLFPILLPLSLAYAPLEARRRVMLGDTGSNALGAAVGTGAAVTLSPIGQCLAVAVLLLFHWWAERHSLSRWIEAHPWARRLDRWGWSSEGDETEGRRDRGTEGMGERESGRVGE